MIVFIISANRAKNCPLYAGINLEKRWEYYYLLRITNINGNDKKRSHCNLIQFESTKIY